MSSTSIPPTGDPDPASAGLQPVPAVAPALITFTLLRIGLTAVLTAALMLIAQVPLIIALTIAIVLQLPLSMLLFGPQRDRLNAALAIRNADRRAERGRLRAELRGDGA